MRGDLRPRGDGSETGQSSLVQQVIDELDVGSSMWLRPPHAKEARGYGCLDRGKERPPLRKDRQSRLHLALVAIMN